MIRFENFNAKSLKELINSKRFQNFPFLPISRHRGESFLQNPNVKPDSVLLILAFVEENLAGYIGVLPDTICTETREIPVGWLSTIYVHSDYRGNKLSQQLLAKACEAYENRILMTEFTSEAEKIYIKSGQFSYLPPLHGISYHYYSDLKNNLPSRNLSWKKWVKVLRIVDFCINSLTPLFYLGQRKKNCKYYINFNFDDEIKDFFEKNKPKYTFLRGENTIDWIVRYPWILSGRKSDGRYHFSDYDSVFQNLFIKIYNTEGLSQVVFLSVRNTKAKIFWIFGKGDIKEVTEVLYQFCLSWKIANLICFEEDINHLLSKKLALYKKARTRKFFIHKDLLSEIGTPFTLKVDAWDGDPVFT